MKDKTTAALYAFFTGVLGIHHFYLENKMRGFIYLGFSWTLIPMFLGVIESISFFRMSTEDFDDKYNKPYVEEKERIDKRKEMLLEKYGAEIGQKLIDGEVWTGMNKEMLIDSLGQPNQTKQDVLKTKIKEKYSYGQYYTDRGTKKFTVEIRLENGEVVGWKEF